MGVPKEVAINAAVNVTINVPQRSQGNVRNKCVFGVVMEGGEGVALVIILCRLTDDLENHTADQKVS